MLSSAVQIVYASLALVFAGAAEELLPKFLEVGFPFLLASSQFFAARRKRTVDAVLFAVAAGAFEDALSSLPPLTSVSFFLSAAFLARFSGMPRASVALAYPAYQLWLVVWVAHLCGGVYGRMLVALPAGAAAAFAAAAAMSFAERKAAVDAHG